MDQLALAEQAERLVAYGDPRLGCAMFESGKASTSAPIMLVGAQVHQPTAPENCYHPIFDSVR